MDLLFFGSGAFGLPTLRALERQHRIRAVISQPDKPAGRGAAMTPTPIAEWAAREMVDVTLLKPEDVNAEAVVAQVQAFKADAAVIIAFGQKLGPAVLPDAPGQHRAMNLHASLLPRWRGAGPINAAILAGDAVTGNSVITIAPRMDAGLVLAQSHLTIDPLMTAGELHDALAEQGPALILQSLSQLRAGTLRGQPQDESLVTRARKLSRKDGFVDFAAGAEECRRRVHGLTPWPGVAVTFRGEPLKLLRVKVIALPQPKGEKDEQPGVLTDAASGDVVCTGSRLRLMEVQPAGGRKMPWADFARGRRVKNGEVMTGGTAL